MLYGFISPAKLTPYFFLLWEVPLSNILLSHFNFEVQLNHVYSEVWFILLANAMCSLTSIYHDCCSKLVMTYKIISVKHPTVAQVDKL